MPSKPESYPALYVIFTLLNAIRRGIERKNIWREFRRQKIALKPRLAFWLALCKEAGLIDDYDNQLRVTRHARAWLSKTPEAQTFHLIDAWQNAPKNKKTRQFRKKLLWKLKYTQRGHKLRLFRRGKAQFVTVGIIQQLRRQPALRKYIEEFLSPQCVLVSSQNAKALFQMLKRRGAYVHNSEEQPMFRQARQPNPKKRAHFPQKVCFEYLWRLAHMRASLHLIPQFDHYFS